MAAVERIAPSVERVEQRSQVQSPVLFGIQRQITPGALQQRPAAHSVPARVMVQGHRNLDQSLQKLAFRFGRGTPDILQDLVRFKETVLIEEPKSFQVRVG